MLCTLCGHRCPTDKPCQKCGGDPLEDGDTLCADCHAVLIDPIDAPEPWRLLFEEAADFLDAISLGLKENGGVTEIRRADLAGLLRAARLVRFNLRHDPARRAADGPEKKCGAEVCCEDPDCPDRKTTP